MDYMKIKPFLIGAAVFFLFGYPATSSAAIREPAVVGTFYPADSLELTTVVQSHLAGVAPEIEIDGQILALVVPHAGLVYSGPVAACAYKLLEGKDIKRVILCGPTHQYRFQGISVFGPFITWKTPLGQVKCDNDYCDRLIRYNKNIEVIRQAHQTEHSLEVQLPYLQTVLNDFQIVPVAMGIQDNVTIEILAEALTSLKPDPGTVMIASTDWQHYRPAAEGSPMDSLGMACLENMDMARLQEYLNSGRVEMCGGGPVMSVMKAALALGADKVKILKYADSGDQSGDKSSVVGYVAAVIYKSQKDAPLSKPAAAPVPLEGKKLPDLFELNGSEKRELLKIARKTLESYLAGTGLPDFDASESLQKFGAAFVTLKKDAGLRGCIGHTSAVAPLYQTVAECAIQAATEDPRFPAVTLDELSGIKIEISVLSPMQPVQDLNEILVGRDGLMIFKGRHRGLLLPQVAGENGWDREEFLAQTCLKAQLDRQSYLAPDVVIYKFQAVIFRE